MVELRGRGAEAIASRPRGEVGGFAPHRTRLPSVNDVRYRRLMRARPLQMPDDRLEVLRFLERAANDGDLSGLSENKLALLERDDGRPGLGVVATEEKSIVGYAGLAPVGESDEWAMEIVTRPDVADPAPLVEAALESVATAGGERVRWWTYTADQHSLPPRFGFEPERDLLRMRRPLPFREAAGFPAGIRVAAFRPGTDDEALRAVNNAAFSEHPDNAAMSSDDLRRRMALDWFDPEGVRMAWDRDDLAGFCWTKIHPTTEGEIYIIGTAPSHQGRGVGKALVREGMRHLTEEGCPEVILFTDADNRRAVALYESLGYTVERTHRAFLQNLTGSGPGLGG